MWTIQRTDDSWLAIAPECPQGQHGGDCRCRLFVTETAARQYAEALGEVG
jgi:hypothetical protein